MTKRKPGKATEAIAVMHQRVGFVRATQITAFLIQWAITMAKHDWEPIGLEDYQKDWNCSRATAFRDQKHFRLAFPNEALPNERLIRARNQWIAEKDAVPAPEVVATAAVLLPFAA